MKGIKAMEQKEFTTYRQDVLDKECFKAKNNTITKIETTKIEKSKCENFNSRFDSYHCND